MVYILLGEGFEEIEAISPLDILRRADIEVTTVSLSNELHVNGGHNITVKADITIEQVDFSELEMLVLPGGLGGVKSISESPAAMDLIQKTWNAKKKLAAICAAPTLLAKLDLLKGLTVTCYPTVSDVIEEAGGTFKPDSVVCDGNLITGQAAGASIEFGLELVAVLRDRETSEELQSALIYNI